MLACSQVVVLKRDLAEPMVKSCGTKVCVPIGGMVLPIRGGGLSSGSSDAKWSERVNDKMFWLRGECGPCVTL